MTEVPPSPRHHIEEIRQEFASNQSKRTSSSLRGALRILSESLYSKETHFILELIQNAEDNLYGEGVRPDLSFILRKQDFTSTPGASGVLVVVNNERGFRHEDVEALCAIGESTKNKREGYIGEKGIGFKSVFVVSRRPHLFSAGYQFRFDEEPDPDTGFGYIVPTWIEHIPLEVEKYTGRTCIVLPLKPGKWEEVRRELEGIAPETLLFLSKLEGLTVDVEGGKRLEVVRDNSKRPLIQFLKDGEYAEFWVAERESTVPQDIYEEKRADITKRKVSIALPLRGYSGPSDRVFAFLPTEMRSGLRFLVNADFLLSASRESILLDRPWNQWLRNCIADAFVDAFRSLLDSDEHRAEAYSFIPLADKVSEEFFKPVVPAIHQALQNLPVVWVNSDDQFVKPERARLTTTKFRSLLGTRPLLAQLQSTPLVHASIAKYSEQLQAIGARQLSSDEIIACLKEDAWLDRQSPEWFASLYEYLSEQKWATAETLRPLRLLLLEDGGRVSLQEQPVYFPEGDIEEVLSLQAKLRTIRIAAILNCKLCEQIRGKRGLTEWVRDVLGVRDLNTASCCVGLAQTMNNQKDTIRVPDLVRASAYIRDHLPDLDETSLQKVKELLPLVVDDGTVVLRSDLKEKQLVVPETLDPDTGWQWVFPDPEDRDGMRVLSNAYLKGCKTDEQRRAWADFFKAMGATDTPTPRRRRSWGTHEPFPQDISPYAREWLQEHSERSTWDHSLDDCPAPEWLCTPTSQKHKYSNRHRKPPRATLHWLKRLLDKPSRQTTDILEAKYTWFYYYEREKRFDSSLTHYLRHAAWLPTTKGPKPPCEAFLDKPELRELFGDALPYVREPVNDSVAKWLGIRSEATTEQMLGYLERMASEDPARADAKIVEKVYTFLSERWRPEMKSRFHTSPLILSRAPKPKWVMPTEVVWPDLSTVFGDAYAYLEPHYQRSLRDFFVEKVGVEDKISEEHYARAWLALAKEPAPDPEKVSRALEYIFPEMLRIAKVQPKPEWWRDFTSKARVWTQKHCFQPPRVVYIPDDGDLRKRFEGKGVAFAWRPDKDSFQDYEALYNALGVRRLSEAVKARIHHCRTEARTPEELLLSGPIKELICAYYRKQHREAYEQAKAAGTVEALLRTVELEVTSLTVEYTLDGIPIREDDAVAFWEREGQRLYRSRRHSKEELEVEVAAIVARALNGGRTLDSLENFTRSILGASDVKIGLIKDKHDLSLPKEERDWIAGILAETRPQPEEMPTPPREDVRIPAIHHPRLHTASGGAGLRDEPLPPRRPSGRSRDRLRSYVEAAHDIGEEKATDEQEQAGISVRDQVEQAGIELVLEYERRNGRVPEELGPHHQGWDINSYEQTEQRADAVSAGCAQGRLLRRVEVKATQAEWGGWGIGMTAAEYRAAQQDPDSYYLYVVEHALDPVRRRLYVFHNPVAKIAEYRFDEAWRQAADEAADPTSAL